MTLQDIKKAEPIKVSLKGVALERKLQDLHSQSFLMETQYPVFRSIFLNVEGIIRFFQDCLWFKVNYIGDLSYQDFNAVTTDVGTFFINDTIDRYQIDVKRRGTFLRVAFLIHSNMDLFTFAHPLLKNFVSKRCVSSVARLVDKRLKVSTAKVSIGSNGVPRRMFKKQVSSFIGDTTKPIFCFEEADERELEERDMYNGFSS